MGNNPELHSKMISEAGSIEYVVEQCGLDRLNIAYHLIMLDDIDGLTYDYGVNVPEDHNSAEYEEWKNKLKACAQGLFPGVRITLATADAVLIANYGTLKEK